MQARLHRGHLDPEDAASLLTGQALEVAHHDHLTRLSIERRDRRVHRLNELPALQRTIEARDGLGLAALAEQAPLARKRSPQLVAGVAHDGLQPAEDTTIADELGSLRDL